MKIYEDYDLAEVYKKYIGKSDVKGLSPKIEPDKNTGRYKLRTYHYDNDNEKFDTKDPVHLAYGLHDECEEVLCEFNALFTILEDYNLTCDIIRAKYINPNSSKAMKKSAIYRRFNLNSADISDKEEILLILKEELGDN